MRRPWGNLEWLLPRLSIATWHLIGVVGAEDRCSSAYVVSKELHRISGCSLFEIIDPLADRRYETLRRAIEKKTTKNVKVLKQAGVSGSSIKRGIPLLSTEEDIVNLLNGYCLNNSESESIIIDISAMPKRFFFPLIALTMRNEKVKNIIVCYTTPEKYGQVLSQNVESKLALPLFNAPHNEPANGRLIVGVGYQLLRLFEIIEDLPIDLRNVRLLFPFPSPPPGYLRNWDIVRHIVDKFNLDDPSMLIRVSTSDVPSIFDAIGALTNNGQIYSMFAPFGPKPISLAMCLYALSNKKFSNPLPAYYTQPLVYSPDYSSGVLKILDRPLVHGYVVRLAGRNLY